MNLFKETRENKISPIIELKVKNNIRNVLKNLNINIGLNDLECNEFLSSYYYKEYYIINRQGLYKNKKCDQASIHTKLHAILLNKSEDNYDYELNLYMKLFIKYINNVYKQFIIFQNQDYIVLNFPNIKKCFNKDDMFSFINSTEYSSFYNIDNFYSSDKNIIYLGFESFIHLDIYFNDIVLLDDVIKIYTNPINSFSKSFEDKLPNFLISQLESTSIPEFEIINEPLFTFELIINRNCNFKCKYCYIQDNTFHDKFINLKYIDDQIKSIITENQLVNFYILGGEPTIHPMFKQLLNYLISHENMFSINVQSNLTFDPEEYKNFNITFDISWHISQIKDEPLYLKKLLLLKKYNQLNSVNIMWEKEYHKDILNLIKKFDMFKIKYTIEPQVNNVDKQLLNDYYEFFDYEKSNYLSKRNHKPIYENIRDTKCNVSNRWRTLNLTDGKTEYYNCTNYFINNFKPNTVTNICELNKCMICGDKDLFK